MHPVVDLDRDLGRDLGRDLDLVIWLQIVITDDLEYGHFIEIEKRISFPHRIRYLTEHPYPRNTCFRCVL